MRKILCTLLSVLMLVSFMGIVGYAEDKEEILVFVLTDADGNEIDRLPVIKNPEAERKLKEALEDERYAPMAPLDVRYGPYYYSWSSRSGVIIGDFYSSLNGRIYVDAAVSGSPTVPYLAINNVTTGEFYGTVNLPSIGGGNYEIDGYLIPGTPSEVFNISLWTTSGNWTAANCKVY